MGYAMMALWIVYFGIGGVLAGVLGFGCATGQVELVGTRWKILALLLTVELSWPFWMLRILWFLALHAKSGRRTR